MAPRSDKDDGKDGAKKAKDKNASASKITKQHGPTGAPLTPAKTPRKRRQTLQATTNSPASAMNLADLNISDGSPAGRAGDTKGKQRMTNEEADEEQAKQTLKALGYPDWETDILIMDMKHHGFPVTVINTMSVPALQTIIAGLEDQRRGQTLHDNRLVPQLKDHEARQAEKENATPAPFVTGNSLRFSILKIRVDPGKGWNFQGPGPKEPPPEPRVEHLKIKIGMTIDGTKGKRNKDNKTGDVKIINNANEPVFLRNTSRNPGYEACDSLGKHLSESEIRYDDAYATREARQQAALNIQSRYKTDKHIADEEQYVRLRDWRATVRNWEIDVLLNEWERQNTVIFPPGTTEQDVTNAVNDLRHQNRQEQIEQTRSFHIGRPSATYIPAQRLDRTEAEVLKRLRNDDQVMTDGPADIPENAGDEGHVSDNNSTSTGAPLDDRQARDETPSPQPESHKTATETPTVVTEAPMLYVAKGSKEAVRRVMTLCNMEARPARDVVDDWKSTGTPYDEMTAVSNQELRRIAKDIMEQQGKRLNNLTEDTHMAGTSNAANKDARIREDAVKRIMKLRRLKQHEAEAMAETLHASGTTFHNVFAMVDGQLRRALQKLDDADADDVFKPQGQQPDQEKPSGEIQGVPPSPPPTQEIPRMYPPEAEQAVKAVVMSGNIQLEKAADLVQRWIDLGVSYDHIVSMDIDTRQKAIKNLINRQEAAGETAAQREKVLPESPEADKDRTQAVRRIARLCKISNDDANTLAGRWNEKGVPFRTIKKMTTQRIRQEIEWLQEPVTTPEKLPDVPDNLKAALRLMYLRNTGPADAMAILDKWSGTGMRYGDMRGLPDEELHTAIDGLTGYTHDRSIKSALTPFASLKALDTALRKDATLAYTHAIQRLIELLGVEEKEAKEILAVAKGRGTPYYEVCCMDEDRLEEDLGGFATEEE